MLRYLLEGLFVCLLIHDVVQSRTVKKEVESEQGDLIVSKLNYEVWYCPTIDRL